MADVDTLELLRTLTAEDRSLGDLITLTAKLAADGEAALADQAYKVWIQFNPDNPLLAVALFNRSILQTALGDNAGAAASLERAIQINPDFLPAYINLGGVQERAGLNELAIATWEAGANRQTVPTGVGVGYAFTCLKQIARLLGDMHQSARAELALQRAAELDPSAMDVIGQLVATRLSQCKWPALQPTERLPRATLLEGVNPLSVAAYTDDPLLLLAAANRFVEREAKIAPERVRADRRDAPIDLTGRRPRIGYISSDLRDHAVGYLMAELFEVHDREKVEVFAYYCGPESSDGLNTRIRAAVEHFVDIRPMSDDEAAQRIAGDGIDILVDVNGHTRDARTALFARRPAPILVNWLGYPGTMGSDYHHYIVADPWIIPPEMELYYSEAVRRIPCYQPNDRRRTVHDVFPTRAEAGLPEDGFVFCCFNGPQKITPHVFERWMRILKRTPGSVLWLLDSNPETNARLRDAAEAAGVDRTRLVFAPKLQNAHHLARYRLADLFLDTTPYGAHTTASDALWMAVPVLTWSGRCFASRVCGSLVRSAGLPELVVDNAEAYVEKAVELGADRAKAQALRATLEANRDSCVLFDMDRLAGALEALYGEMVAEHGAGRRPRPNLANLDAYLDIGLALDRDDREMQAEPDLHDLYRREMARRDQVKAIPADGRLWDGQPHSGGSAPVFQSPAAAPTPPDVASELAAAIATARDPRSGLHPLGRMKFYHDAVSLILCEPLTPERLDLFEALLAEAAAMTVEAPGPEWVDWVNHYRSVMAALTDAGLRDPAPLAPDHAPRVFLTGDGRTLDGEGLKAHAEALGAQVVFFAAADPRYVELYGRWLARSVLKHADVPFLVLIHVIGGAGKLEAAAATVGVEDPRVVYVGDDFDAAAVTTLCYEAPPKGLVEIPVAHYQSARFQRLGGLLDLLGLPVFVSDIDLLLQRGVADLLDEHAEADVVLNLNDRTVQAGSRITANLLLARPTPATAILLRWLRAYLDARLAGPTVTRWIDQVALNLARHHLALHAPDAHVETFDTRTDINNVMFKAYVPGHPFRFLSLYHGFDLSTLEA